MSEVVSSPAAEFEALRPRLFGLAYRILGSRADAEDVVQDVFLRWHDVDRATIQSSSAYLLTVTSRLALDVLKSARRQREEYVGVWLPEPLVSSLQGLDDSVEKQESLSLAFLFVMESLGPAERVAFILREVFDQDYSEIALTLDVSAANARQLVTRARKHLLDRSPRFTASKQQHLAVLQAFFTAAAANDTSTLVDLLREDAVAYSDGGGKASAAIHPVRTADHVARFFAGLARKFGVGVEWRLVQANGSPAVVFLRDGEVDSLASFELDANHKIQNIFVIRNPDKLESAKQATVDRGRDANSSRTS